MTRFFVAPEQIAGNDVTLDADDAHHLRVVLHASVGETIAVLDGLGNEYTATLTALTKTSAAARVTSVWKLDSEAHTRITVAQALPKMSEKMEQVLQRCTEIGATGFIVFAADKGQVHLEGERQGKREGRWAAIVKTAAEQAHRAVLPTIRYTNSLGAVMKERSSYDLVLLAHIDSSSKPIRDVLHALPAVPQRILLIIGPESGLTASEATNACKAGAQMISLGPRILRTETAAMALTAQLLYALEP